MIGLFSVVISVVAVNVILLGGVVFCAYHAG